MPRIPYQDQARAVLDIMVEEADDKGLWQGKLTDLIARVSSLSSYSFLVNILTSSGAISQVKRGGGSSPSIWQVVDANTDLSLGSPNTSPLRKKKATLADRLGALERKIDQVMIEHLKEHHGH